MNNTITAVSTAYGEGGIGIVRISGEKAGEILGKLFRRGGEDVAISGETAFQNKRMYYGHIIEPSSIETIDEVLVVFMKEPHTYTGEDVAEIHCHGSVVSLRRILEKTLECGASLAEAGEFTKRAFLNGRIDLAQADAVIDIIRAKTERGYEAAIGQLEGRLSAQINGLRDKLTDVLAEVVVNMDYPDEDAEEKDTATALAASIETRLSEVDRSLNELIERADVGRMIRDGVRVVIVGKPNAGKSSLLNALLREARAIVSEIPGTTRDSIDEYLNLRGIPVKLTDTAGMRDTENAVEALGVARSKEALIGADIVMLTLDGSRALDAEDLKIIETLTERRDGGTCANGENVVAVVNKSDLPEMIDGGKIAQLLPGITVISVSAMTGEGIGDIEDCIVSAVYGGKVKQGESLLVTNAAHKTLLERAAAETKSAMELLRIGEALDFAETEIRSAHDTLGEITGQTVTDDILDRVFSRFCVGK
ncbi:MAG: tRNA uridine-5-carboxymethylaminomethyl(34) synthesis GTPase MnmE [Clostridiales Family XIII bacterium]|jgi:tRNA modification GTPase|nr:tRNA uridine-5-carboxymethylaminomethyl(34) synthesis GTPase MnmE [Clostridiales Family XIII bacterium]